MAKVRYLKPQALYDEDVVSMSMVARYVWAYLPCIADRAGRLIDKPISIKLELLPNDSVDMDAILNEIAEKKHIERYMVGEKKYIQIRSFLKHQKPWTNEPQSVIPQKGFVMSNTQNLSREMFGTTKDLQTLPDPEQVSLLLKTKDLKLKTEDLASQTEGAIDFNTNSFQLLFGEWPPSDNPKYNESRIRAEAAFFENINPINYNAFVEAWNLQLDLYKKDKSKDRRKFLGTFRTFCEGRWMNVTRVASYTEPSKNNKIDENFADIK